jgi:hypothetical protein
MKYFLANVANANTDITIYDHSPSFYEAKEITEKEALQMLYEEVDPMHNYDISEYKLTHSESLQRYGITYK